MSKVKRPSQQYPIVECWWDDATNLQMGWKNKTEFEKESAQLEMIISVGFLVRETPDHIVLAMDLDKEGAHNQRGQIPRPMIKKIKILRKADTKNEQLV